MCWLFSSGGQSIGASVSASVLLMNIQDWFPLGSTGLIALLFKGLSRVFSIKHAATAAKSLLLCPTLCNPIDGSPPGSPVHGILQARILEWVAISIWQKDWESPGNLTLKVSRIWLQNFHRTRGNRGYWRIQTKPCVHQHPGERRSDPHKRLSQCSFITLLLLA